MVDNQDISPKIITINDPSHFPILRKIRCSSAPESWVRWRSSAMSVSARLCLGCRLTSEVTCLVKTIRNFRSNAWPLWSSRGTWGNTFSSAHGRGGNCGRRSSRCSTSLASKMRWPWVFFYSSLCKIFGAKEGLSFKREEILNQHWTNYVGISLYQLNCSGRKKCYFIFFSLLIQIWILVFSFLSKIYFN